MKRLIAVAMVAACVCALGAFGVKAGPLPECFTQVEYIESTRAQSINTGFAPTDRTILELDCTLRYTAQQALFSSGAWGNNHFLLVTSGAAKFTFYGTGSSLLTATLDHRYLIQTGDGVVRIKDLSAGGGVCSALSTLGNTSAITLFSANGSYNAGYRLHSCRITDNGTLVRDFIPCVSNGVDEVKVAGLYDTVGDKFYMRSNAKAADFTAGPAIDYDGMLDVRFSSEVISPAADPSGVVTGLKSGDQRTLTAPETATDAFGNLYDCTGCRIYGAKYDSTSGRMVPDPDAEIEGSPFSGTSVAYTHGGEMRIAVWQYALRDAADPDDFDYCVEFTAPKVTHGLNETEFQGVPVLVRLRDDPTKFSYDKLAYPDEGTDIAFFAADGTPLPHEIDNWNRDGESTVWVKLPELKTGVKFRMCFGCASSAKCVAQKPSTVWSDYQGVWHLNAMAEKDGVVGTADATGNGLTANVNNTTTTAEQDEGAVGNAYLGRTAAGGMSSGLIVPGSSASLDLSSFTISGWLRRPGRSFIGGDTPFSTKTSKAASGGGFAPAQGNMAIQLQLYLTGSDNAGYYDRVMDINFYPWTYFTLSYVSNSVTGGSFTLTVNGASVYSASRNYAVSGRDLALGAFSGATTGWQGPLDEMRWIKKALSTWRVKADYEMVKNADYFAVQGVTHGIAKTLTVTKYIPELDLDLDLPECHQTCLSATDCAFTCSATRDRFVTVGDIAYECTGCVFTPADGGDPVGYDGTSFTFRPATMDGGTLQWRFERAGYRARVHDLPPYLAGKATVTVTPDSDGNRLFDCFYKEGTVLTVTLTENEEGVFTRWCGAAGMALEDRTAKTVAYTVNATADNPDLVAEVCGIAFRDDDTRLPSDNCARTPKSRYLYLSTEGDDTNDGLTEETPLKSIVKAVEVARAGYAADGAQQVVLVAPGDYTGYGIRMQPISEPIVFDGGTNNPSFTANEGITGESGATYYYKLTGDRAAFRRLTVKVTGTSTGSKAAGILSVTAGTCESVVMTNLCTGTDYNAAEGCIYLSGTGVITNCLVTQCHSDCPGVVKTTHGIVKMAGGLLARTRITGCRVGGTTEGQGGGVYMTGGTIRNCLIDNCTAFTQGSGLYVPAATACTVENCTIVDCGPSSGSTADLYGAYLSGASGKAIRFVNNVVYGNSGASSSKKDVLNIYRNSATYVTLFNNLSDAEFPEDATTSGNVAGDPSFTDRAGRDYTIGRGLARNAGQELAWALGTDETDLAGNARFLENALDIGCYEYMPSGALEVSITVVKPEGFKFGDEVTLVCEASGGAGDYTYAWYFGETLVASGTDAETNVAVTKMGITDVTCVVTDAAGAQVTRVQEGAIRLFVDRVFVAVNGKHVSPFDSWENAATNFEDSVAILDATRDCTVTVGPGAYVLTKEISLAQKTSFVSTDGADATVLRPQPGVSAFAVLGQGTVIEGFTVEGMSGAARGLTAGTTLYMTNVCFRNCSVSASPFIWTPNSASVNTMNLTLNCVTNLGGCWFGGEETNTSDYHRNLRVLNSRASGYGCSFARHGFVVRNGLFWNVKTGSGLVYSQCGGTLIQLRNVTVDNSVCGGSVLVSNSGGGDLYYVYNSVFGRVWTSDAKTALRIVGGNSGARCYYSSFPAEETAGGVFDHCLTENDARTRRGGYLRSGSPCLGKGNPDYCAAYDTDLDGKPRLHVRGETTTVNMGCYENDPPGLMLMLK